MVLSFARKRLDDAVEAKERVVFKRRDGIVGSNIGSAIDWRKHLSNSDIVAYQRLERNILAPPALEPAARGIYAGSILYLDYAGNLDSCIAIRTLVLRDGQAEVQAGAGIVADSVPAREYEETMNKAGALLRAVELAERGL